MTLRKIFYEKESNKWVLNSPDNSYHYHKVNKKSTAKLLQKLYDQDDKIKQKINQLTISRKQKIKKINEILKRD